MSTLQLSLPDDVRYFVDEQVSRGGFGNADEYVCALLRREKETGIRDHLRALLQEGIDSGGPLGGGRRVLAGARGGARHCKPAEVKPLRIMPLAREELDSTSAFIAAQ